MEPDKKSELLEEAARRLAEHFDSVQIIAVAQSSDGDDVVSSYSSGSGSFYERLGAVREWVIRQDEQVKVQVRHEALDGDGGEQ